MTRQNVAWLFSTVFNVGTLPKAPGTWGSLAALIGWFIFMQWGTQEVFLILTGFIFFGGVISSEIVSKTLKAKDPSVVVIDEWVGQWIALWFVPVTLCWGLLAFFLFRLFDIFKPGPIKSMESLPSGLGIMMDDVVAGLFSLFITHSLIYYIG
ncbi:MAG: phosphatidylglycerophosphatase A [Candidatus Marinimicrobia bacterium]|jgi:phosphatidylglycerophosphatase A|nr:phosphatidylglycerophosphatase A [Candidatus Neomarinimicrobiota bacterium]MBT3937130.1 phosphatidylglycerophosphatase A [Candidatus Neomarinimicrobiota bacterium]MBT3962100.1 phosphatidylglycerophosphatase A [Candidatus Neomarinimicrobiota bacterium]MBT4382468.1 phosphatidylglycerophosphatase A [Candidatus Neomarinimicrobiota bacterium]MBT4636585.1 phosphatidylglycerophosphatase A [Candidatus Neomarinimicrobiota bacterium]